MPLVPINRALNPAQLDAELRVAVPALFTTAGGLPIARYSLTPKGTDQWVLEIPADVSLATVQAAVTAHNAATQTAQQQQEVSDSTSLSGLRDNVVAAITRLDAIQAAPPSTTANLASLLRLETAVKDMAGYQETTIRALVSLLRQRAAVPTAKSVDTPIKGKR